MTDYTSATQDTTTAGDGFLSRPLLATLDIDWEKAIYLTFIILAFVTRFWALGDRVMSHDESLHTQFSYQYFNGDGYSHTPLMHGPFLFHATAIAYWLFGDSDFVARVPVALLGVFLVAMPYFLRPWLGRIGALFTSFIFLISPYISYYSRYIRHDIYVITWALIVFLAILYFLREPKSRYLWIFAAGLALMFSTKEVAFIYVAIFGSFLVVRLLVRLLGEPWLRDVLPTLRTALLITLAGVLLVGVGLGAHILQDDQPVEATPAATSEGFAVDPNAELAPVQQDEDGPDIFQWVELLGIGLFALGAFLIIRGMRPHIDGIGEFDLIILFSTLLLPLITPLLVRIAGWNPQDYTINTCMLAGQETMTGMQIFVARLTNVTCITSFLESGMVRIGVFLAITLTISILVGLWWDKKRWIIAAIIFHAIFFVLYTSVFTNLGGWRTGMIGSLGYWLEQQGVERGSQPWFYYFFVMPLYEFLPVVFALAGAYLWTKTQRLNKIVWYWVALAAAMWVAFSFANWLFNRDILDPVEQSQIPGLLAAAALLLAGLAYWFLVRRRQVRAAYELDNGLLSLVNWQALVSFVPFLVWWMVLTWAAYSLAGEKMPWLSTHFVIPMAMLSGWYFNEKLRGFSQRDLLNSRTMLVLGLTMLLIIVAAVALGPLVLGRIEWGNQELANLRSMGRFIGGLLVAGALLYVWRRFYTQLELGVRSAVVSLAIFGVLALMTIRFSVMANTRNADYTNEFLVYAHGAPATKSVVLSQLEDLSMRLHGDKSIRVAYDSDVSWPMTWYLRDYPNRVFFGENPTQSLNESPVVIVGRKNWEAVDPFLANNYTRREYTFLWWPMEEYRKFSWNALLGNSSDVVRRGLGNPDVRQALWDIFFYRDYTKYGEVFGGTYTAGQWPLRHDLRLYVRNDVLGNIWDYGVGAVAAAPLEDPYEQNALVLSPNLLINESSAAGSEPGALSSPRNLAVGPDGLIYVADSGNNRIQVFDPEGAFVREWGAAGSNPGEFNEPWGLAIDNEHVYVADTWNHRVQKFTLEGQPVGVFGTSGTPSGQEPDGGLGLFFGPRDIAVLQNGQLLVSDTGNHRLQLLDTNGRFLQQVGGFGNLAGQFNEPVGLAVGPDGIVYVADTWNGRIQRLSPDLNYLGEWRVDAWYGQSINNKPYLDTDSNGRVYVTDPEGYRVLIFSPEGAYLNRFGQFGADATSFGLPNGIALDGSDNILVADSGNHRVARFDALYGSLPVGVEPEDLNAPSDDGLAPLEENEPLASPLGQESTFPTPTTADE